MVVLSEIVSDLLQDDESQRTAIAQLANLVDESEGEVAEEIGKCGRSLLPALPVARPMSLRSRPLVSCRWSMIAIGRGRP